jgi:outer membrane protein
MKKLWPVLLGCQLLAAPDAKVLTLAEAQAIAIRNHPRVSSATLAAQAANAVMAEVRSAYFPAVYGNLTGVRADEGTSVAAGNVTTSSVNTRTAGGLLVTQLLTDFGRTASLARSARERAGAQSENVAAARAQVLLRVKQAYFNALLAQSVLKVAQDTLAGRQLTLKQVTALFRSNLKSSLDVSFAEVNQSEAELLLFRAENDIKAAFSNLSAAMGFESEQRFQLAEEALPAPLDPSPEPLIRQALRQRPDLITLRLQHQADLSFAESERRLKLPSVSAIGAGGAIPVRDARLRGHYGAIGFNVSVPVFNGHLFSARRAEAELKAQAAAEDVRDLEIRIANDVKVAWLNAQTAFRRLDVAARLLEQARRSGRLAQARYNLGLASIVELNQAQLNQTSAEIGSATARYDYQIRRAMLDFQAGILR